ncbi:protein of unknown function [Legionella micdadei]|uniref:Uncharacterized protein n=1 Tax=Legionella micdadei TaxID=451 RepID=A0A098GEV2_LEGMI|nr:protein of unknown function [Legionella micdadei]
MTDQNNIKINKDILSSVIKGNLSDYYNQPLTPDNINVIAQQLIESIDNFINKKEG